MLTSEERDVVVAAMRKYPSGVHAESWGKSDDFFCDNIPIGECGDIEGLADAILLEHG